ncbi:MAG: hypothetical protein K2X91_16310, partial [Thermoleophilia bacterium]|nr:hypothetical protein [Thermoleophilia bacterium]
MNLIGYELDGTRNPSEVQAYARNASIDARGDLRLTATADATIKTEVLSGSVAVAGGTTGVGLGGAGSTAENQIATLIRAYVDGNGARGIRAGNLVLEAVDTSEIDATAGSASLAAGFGLSGVAVSIGTGLARNTISNEVESYIVGATNVSTGADRTSADGSVALRPGDRVRLASDYAVPRFDTTSPAAFQVNTTPLTKTRITDLFPNDVVRLLQDFDTTADSGRLTKVRQVTPGDFVLATPGYAGTGQSGRIYRYLGAAGLRDLADQDFANAGLWAPVNGVAGATYRFVGAAGSRDLKLQDFTSASWTRIGGTAGRVYAYNGPQATRDLGGQDYADAALWTEVNPGDIRLTALEEATIDATAKAASAAVGAGFLAVGVSGAGAEATNVILTKTNASVRDSDLDSGRDIVLTAIQTATITAEILALSSAAGGGAIGVGVAIGSATAKNFIGYTRDGVRQPVEVQAYVTNASLDAARNLEQTARSTSIITSSLDSDSVALAGGGVAVAASGAGADVNNRVSARVRSFIESTRGTGVDAGAGITLLATDTSIVTATTRALSVAGSVGAYGGSAAIGVATAANTIRNEVEAF